MAAKSAGAFSQTGRFAITLPNYSLLCRALPNLLPGRCSTCHGKLQTPHQCICNACVSELPWLKNHCPQCAEPLACDMLCPDCQSTPPSFNRCITAFTYQEPIDRIILRLKKDPFTAEIKQLTALLAEKILSSYQRNEPLAQRDTEIKYPLPDLIFPMPLHWKKILRRGFNQSQIISDHLVSYLLRQHKISLRVCSHICQRVSNTQPQQTLDRKQRAKSVRNAFSISTQSQISLKGKSVAIIDDVVTTGATADALARKVVSAGAKSVDIWCLARTGWNNCSR